MWENGKGPGEPTEHQGFWRGRDSSGLRVPVTDVSYMFLAKPASYRGPREAVILVRIWTLLRHVRQPSCIRGRGGASAPHWESEGLTLLIVFFREIFYWTGDPIPSPFSPKAQ